LPGAVDLAWRPGWPVLAELGIAGFCVPEELGGFGLRADAAVAVGMELGAALHAAPFAGITASGYALGRAVPSSPAIADVLEGTRSCSFGWLSADGSTARLVDGGRDADALLLADYSGGITLFSDSSAWKLAPAHHAFDVSRDCVDIAVGPDLGSTLPMDLARSTEALFRLLLCADSVGGLQRVLDHTVAYATGRSAFGRPIGGFQAVQHRLVDHAVTVRGMRLLLAAAAESFGVDPDESLRDVAVAEVSITQGAAHLIHDLLQLTGAIGFTWEYGLHFFDRRAHHNARLAGNPRAALASLAAIEGWTA
jgi:alkylation response protein AidB-like acyl-CoA dehydrogenase